MLRHEHKHIDAARVYSLLHQVVLVFRGDFAIEADLSPNVTSWDILGLGSACPGCTVNARAAQAYVEAREATNNWELSRARVEETGLQYRSVEIATPTRKARDAESTTVI